MNKTSVLECLAEEYPQLYLNPDTDTREAYRRVVLRGEEPEKKSLSHYRGDPADRVQLATNPHAPCGLPREGKSGGAETLHCRPGKLHRYIGSAIPGTV